MGRLRNGRGALDDLRRRLLIYGGNQPACDRRRFFLAEVAFR